MPNIREDAFRDLQKIISEKYESEALSTFFETVNHKFENKSQLEKSSCEIIAGRYNSR